jgi:hypothetical protein
MGEGRGDSHLGDIPLLAIFCGPIGFCEGVDRHGQNRRQEAFVQAIHWRLHSTDNVQSDTCLPFRPWIDYDARRGVRAGRNMEGGW